MELDPILATANTQFGQEMALVMQLNHACAALTVSRSCRQAFVFFHWKCTRVLQKSLSLSIKQTCFKRYHHDLLRHLVACSKFEWFMSSDPKIKNFSTHFVHKTWRPLGRGQDAESKFSQSAFIPQPLHIYLKDSAHCLYPFRIDS